MINQTPFADLVESGLAGDPRNGSIWRAFRQLFNAHQLADWRADLARLQASGLGPAGLEAYIRAAGTLAEHRGPLAALALAPCILDVERHAGRAAAAALSEATSPALRHLGNERYFRDWLDAVAELAAQGPESVMSVLARSDSLLAELGAHGFRAWVLGGLRAGGSNPERRLALFSLSDPRAFDLFEQATGDIGFTDLERALKAYLMALFMILAVIVGSQVVLQNMVTQGRRQRESETIWRGNQWARAIRLYFHKTGHYPQSVDDLQKGLPDLHFLRLQRQAEERD